MLLLFYLFFITTISGVQMMGQGIILSLLRMYGAAMIAFLFLLATALTAKQVKFLS